ncbi:MAG: SagB family peptide dehydrogenase [Isosphaeraceae bacterium]
MTTTTWIALRDGVTASRSDDGGDGVIVEGHGLRVSMRLAGAVIVDAILGLASPGGDEERTEADLLEAGGPTALASWYYAIERLERRGLLVRSLVANGRPIASLVPMTTTLAPPAGVAVFPTAGPRYRLCRFAFLRREGETLVIESPRSAVRIVLHDPAAAVVIAGLAAWSSRNELFILADALPPGAVDGVVQLLANAGMIEADDGGSRSEGHRLNDDPAEWWEFHDLLFHARSRRGRCDHPFGATYRLAGRAAVPPPVREIPPGESIRLPRPDPDRLGREDPPLFRVVEARRSERTPGGRPIALEQLGEFLYRVARVRGEQAVTLETPAGPVRTDFVARPYPSGGALYELEFYAVVSVCEGLGPGLYYYEPRGHALVALRGATEEVEGLLRDAAGSATIPPETIQVLLIVTARFPRLAWKYSAMAYALVLKHVGVVYQNMYLAATAMGLAPCALGGGDSDLFARASGIDIHAETSVGEFLLGTRAQAPAPQDPGQNVPREEPVRNS